MSPNIFSEHAVIQPTSTRALLIARSEACLGNACMRRHASELYSALLAVAVGQFGDRSRRLQGEVGCKGMQLGGCSLLLTNSPPTWSQA